MSAANAIPQSGVRIVETRRQMHDRLAALLATLSAPTSGTAAAMRARAAEAEGLAEALGDAPAMLHARRVSALADLAENRLEAALAGFMGVLRRLDEADEGGGAAETLVTIARIRSMLGDLPGAHAALQNAYQRYAELQDADGLALTSTARGNLFADAGDYPRALECHAEALKLREQHGDEEQIGVCTFDVSMIYAAIGDGATAIELFGQSCRLFERCGAYDLHARAVSALAALLVSEGRLEEALASSLHALVLLEIVGDQDAIIETLMNIASIHERSGRAQDAVATLQKATVMAERGGKPGRLAATLLGLAGVERRSGRPRHAASALDRALRLAGDDGDRVLACRIHEELAATFEEMSSADKALEHYRQFMALRDTLHGEEQRRAIAEVNLKLALERAQQERDLYRVRSERLAADLEMKVRELASASLAAVQNNRVLNQLEERVVERFKGRRDAQLIVREVRREIASLRDAAGEWTPFEERLDALHQDFIRTLRGLHPDLTQAQMMICALLRANFDTRAIAGALCLSERTVENHRYRLRRKLGLAADVNLASYLASLPVPSSDQDAGP